MAVKRARTREVLLSREARQDLNDIRADAVARQGADLADATMAALKVAVESLENTPRGTLVPPELERAGVTRYRELPCPPWRIIYEPTPEAVLVHWIFDARRDVAGQLLQKICRIPRKV